MYIRILTISLTTLCILSCSSERKDSDIPEPRPSLVGIAFGGSNDTWHEAPTSRGSETGLENMFNSFRVWGYKTTATDFYAPQVVIDGYNVEYKLNGAGTTATNTANWEYVGITNKNLSTPQTIKYWDYSASSYRFFAYTPADANITPSKSTTNTTQAANAFNIPYIYSKDAKAKNMPYISELWYGDNTATTSLYGKCVTMKFAPLIAKVRFKFSYPEGADAVVIKDIQFRDSRFLADPTTATTPLRGTITATYPLQGIPTSSSPTLSWTTTDTAEGSGASSTGPLILTIPYEEEGDRIHNVSDKSLYGKWYYVPPFNAIPYSQGAYTITANIDGRYASATVPEEFMQWKAGYQYTYIFKITEAGTVISFSDLQVEKWLTGSNIDNNGSGTEDW